MLYVYLCDDNPFHREHYCKRITQSFCLKNWDLKMEYAASSPEELLLHLPPKDETGLYFLDLEFSSDTDGFQLANQIRQKDPRAFIVFLTSHSDKAMLTFHYHLEALDFIPKSLKSESLQARIASCVNTAYRRYQLLTSESERFLTFKRGTSLAYIPYSQILYIQSSEVPHQFLVTTEQGQTGYSGSLNDILSQYDTLFFRISRSCLVNLSKIQSFSSKTKELCLKNGTVLPCSIRSLNALKKRLTD